MPSPSQIWRDFKTDGEPASGAHQPDKPEIRAWAASVEDRLAHRGGYPTLAAAAAEAVPPLVGFIRVEGRAAPGDGGQALYARVVGEPAHGGKFQSDDGAWWELAERVVRPEMYGAAGDGVTNDQAAMMAMADHARARGFLEMKGTAGRIYTYDVPQFLGGIRTISIKGNGCALRNLRGTSATVGFVENGTGLVFGGYFNAGNPWSLYAGSGTPYSYGQKIETVAAGASTVEVKAGEGAPAPQVGDWVFVFGFATLDQEASFPPACRFMDWAKVVSINSQQVTLDRPLRHNYDSRWRENTASGSPYHFGAPRLLRLQNVIERLEIEDLSILANPGWTNAEATGANLHRNGRAQFGGALAVHLRNVSVAGSCYLTCFQDLDWDGGRADLTELDKCGGAAEIRRTSFKQLFGGTGVERARMSGVRIDQQLNLACTLETDWDRCDLPFNSGTGNLLLVTSITSARMRFSECRFRVGASTWRGFINHTNFSASFAVVDAANLSLTTSAYDAANVSRTARPGSRLHNAAGEPVFELTAAPYEDSGNVIFPGRTLGTIANPETLYLAAAADLLEVIDPIFDTQWRPPTLTTGGAISIPPVTRLRGMGYELGSFVFSSADFDPAVTEDGGDVYRMLGGAWVWTEIDVVVSKAYSGSDAGARLLQIIDLSAGGSTYIQVDLKTLGHRRTWRGGALAALGADVVPTFPTSTRPRLVRFRMSTAYTDIDAVKAAAWTAKISGFRVGG